MMKIGQLVTRFGEPLKVVSQPRYISGGCVVKVERTEDNPAQMLLDGTIHPMHQKGFSWEEPTCNLKELSV
jgi:hypothetical protein